MAHLANRNDMNTQGSSFGHGKAGTDLLHMDGGHIRPARRCIPLCMNHKKGGPRTCLRPASPQKRIQQIYKPEFASDGFVTILHSIVFLVDAGRAPVGMPLELFSVLLRGTHVNWGIEI